MQNQQMVCFSVNLFWRNSLKPSLCTWLLLRPLLVASISFSLSFGYLNQTPDYFSFRP
jgi:hypothetical protein